MAVVTVRILVNVLCVELYSFTVGVVALLVAEVEVKVALCTGVAVVVIVDVVVVVDVVLSAVHIVAVGLGDVVVDDRCRRCCCCSIFLVGVMAINNNNGLK